jgi:hypothetical protein
MDWLTVARYPLRSNDLKTRRGRHIWRTIFLGYRCFQPNMCKLEIGASFVNRLCVVHPLKALIGHRTTVAGVHLRSPTTSDHHPPSKQTQWWWSRFLSSFDILLLLMPFTHSLRCNFLL